jgi:hypothetical protein
VSRAGPRSREDAHRPIRDPTQSRDLGPAHLRKSDKLEELARETGIEPRASLRRGHSCGGIDRALEGRAMLEHVRNYGRFARVLR